MYSDRGVQENRDNDSVQGEKPALPQAKALKDDYFIFMSLHKLNLPSQSPHSETLSLGEITVWFSSMPSSNLDIVMAML